MRIHREGVRITLWVLLICLIIGVATWLFFNLLWFIVVSVLLLCLLLFVTHFFRNPRRLCVASDAAIYAPADGRIVAIERTEEPEVFKGPALQISVFMSVWNVHANYYPVAGTVSYTCYHPGRFLVAWLPKSSTENERSTVAITRQDGVVIALRQIAGAVARRIVTYSQPGDTAQQGGELGFIKFGSRVDIFLPVDAAVSVKLGDRVRSRESVLARLPQAREQ